MCFLKEILKGVLNSRFFCVFYSKNNFFGASAFLRLAFFSISKQKAFPVFCDIFSSFCDKQFSHRNAKFRFLKNLKVFFLSFFFLCFFGVFSMPFIHFDNVFYWLFFLNSFLIKNASLTMFVHSPPPFPLLPFTSVHHNHKQSVTSGR